MPRQSRPADSSADGPWGKGVPTRCMGTVRRAAEEFQATDQVAAVGPGGGLHSPPQSTRVGVASARPAPPPCIQAAARCGPGLLPPKAALIAHALGKCRRETPTRRSDVPLPPLSPPWAPPEVYSTDPQRPRVGAGPHPHNAGASQVLGRCWTEAAPHPQPSACTALLPASWLQGGRPVPPRRSGCRLGVCSPGARSTPPPG